jgi:hypothetical protein
MTNNDITCAFRSLLADLAALEPRNGFQVPADVVMTAEQIGTVVAYEPDTMADALCDALPAIAGHLSSNPAAKAAIADLVIDALSKAAHRVALREAAVYCDEAAMAADDDRAYDAGRAGAAVRGFAYSAGLSVSAAL